MANIGNATLTITPKFDGLTSSINSALGNANVAAGAKSVGGTIASGIGSGMISSAAIFGAFSNITSSAINSITSHIGSAVSRLDTLKAYPRVMESLGYSTEEANDSIQKMSDRLSNLPTTLDSMTSTVQGIAAVTGNLEQATDVGLALNDMLLASGSSTQLTTAAMEQFRQMLAKGKPEMQDWKSLTQAMPGQMKQLAEALLGTGASANDLYTALGGGGAEATLTMEQLMNAMIALDQDGGGAFESFADQAETASGGIGTAMANMQNAITKGITSVMDSIGQETISGAIDSIKSGINEAFSVISQVAATVTPVIKTIISALGEMSPAIITAVVAFKGFTTINSIFVGLGQTLTTVSGGLSTLANFLQPAGGALQDAAKGAQALGSALTGNVVNSAKKAADTVEDAAKGAAKLGDTAGDAAEGAATLGSALGGPLSIGLALVATAVVACAIDIATYNEKMDDFENSISAAADSCKVATSEIGNIGDAADKASGKVSGAAMSVSEWTTWNNQLAQSMEQTTQNASDQMARLDYAGSIIDSYANKSNLTATEQTLLKDAIETVNAAGGEQYSIVDLANGKIQDQNGIIQENTDSIWANIDALKQQLQVQALSENYQTAYAAQIEAQGEYEKALAAFQNANPGDNQAYTEAKENLDAARESLQGTTEDVQYLSDAMAEATGGTADFGNAADNLHNNLELATAVFGDGTAEMDNFKAALDDAGISWDQFGSLSRESAEGLIQAFADGELSAEELQTALLELNNTEIDPKEATVLVDDTQLIDANGEVVVWNNGQLKHLDGSAYADTTTVRDGNNRVYVWNGSYLKQLTGSANVHAASVQTALDLRKKWNDGYFKSFSTTATVMYSVKQALSTIKSSNEGGSFAKGGIRTHADGGIRKHADGFIANRPGAGVPLDIVGEAGAEAIVPLTNRRYSQPFVDLIAEGVEKRLDIDESKPTVVQNFQTKVIRTDDDIYSAAAILDRIALREAMSYA